MPQQQEKGDNSKKKHLMWQLSLALVFLCFGMLVMAQYNTHMRQSGSLEGASVSDLGMILKSVTDNKSLLEAELSSLNAELAATKAAIASGDSTTATAAGRIAALKTAIGWQEVSGPGIAVTITGSANLLYQDIIDIVNELMNSGAEAVSVNDVRITMHTQITEAARSNEVWNEQTATLEKQDYYVIIVNGQELLTPIVIRAIGDAGTLETALTYPGGIVSNLQTLYGVNPTIRQAANLLLPAAVIPEYVYAAEPAKTAPAAN